MKKIVIIIFCILFQTINYAVGDNGSFGVTKGMNPNELSKLIKLKMSDENNNIYFSNQAPISNSSIDKYYYLFSKNKKICKVLGIKEITNDNVYGLETKSKYEYLKDALSSKYGNPRDYDLLMSGSIWDKPEDWTMSLLKKDRLFASIWDQENRDSKITLEVVGDTRYSTQIHLTYEFDEMQECLEDKKRADVKGL